MPRQRDEVLPAWRITTSDGALVCLLVGPAPRAPDLLTYARIGPEGLVDCSQ